MSLDTAKRNCLLGRAALVLTTIIWGASFVVLKDALDQMPTLYVLAYRFTGASILLFLFGIKEIKKIDKSYLRCGFLMGTTLFIAYTVQTFGLYYTTPGKNAFLTTTYCVLTPFLYWMTDKKKPDAYNIIAAFVCVAGVGLVSVQRGMDINIGDMLTLCCGLFFAIHIVLTGKFIKDKSVFLLTAIQFAVAGVYTWAFALSDGSVPPVPTGGLLWRLVFLCVMCTAVCYALQTYGQRYTPPSSVAVIMTLESVFGTTISVSLGYEVLTTQIFIGFCLIFFAVFVSETKFSFLKKRKVSKEMTREQ